MSLRFCVLALALATAFPVIAQQAPPRRHAPDPTNVRVQPDGQLAGDPLPGLTNAELDAFAEGLDEFLNTEDEEGGLGPIFNGRSCVSCHSVPAPGGSSAINVTRFGLRDSHGFDPLADLGGSLQQRFAIAPEAQEIVPDIANVVIQRNSTPLFGLGLIEAIPDQAILDNARRPNADGIRGVPAIVDDLGRGGQRVGRFGWKAQLATLLDFAGDAYLNEMGITSRIFPDENAPNGNLELLARYDTVADPEDEVDPITGKGDIDHAADYMRLLAPPRQRRLDDQGRAGERVFNDLGCAACHTPRFDTGRSPIAALDRKPVLLYSDLLLHNMGRLNDGIAQGAASTDQMKTAPLWGLRDSAPYLHDGRAATVDAAIREHDGEGARSRDRYRRLGDRERRQLQAFLDSI